MEIMEDTGAYASGGCRVESGIRNPKLSHLCTFQHNQLPMKHDDASFNVTWPQD